MKSSGLKILFPLFLLSTMVGPLCAGTSLPVVQGLTLANGSNAAANPYYRKVVDSIGKPLLFEKAKILYLVGQVRRSPCEFERNGEVVKGPKAASHLLMKYRVAGGRIKTAEQFIQYLASKSSMTGRPYYVKAPLGAKHTLQDVLMNELFLLNQALRESDLSGIQYRMIHHGKSPPLRKT